MRFLNSISKGLHESRLHFWTAKLQIFKTLTSSWPAYQILLMFSWVMTLLTFKLHLALQNMVIKSLPLFLGLPNEQGQQFQTGAGPKVSICQSMEELKLSSGANKTMKAGSAGNSIRWGVVLQNNILCCLIVRAACWLPQHTYFRTVRLCIYLPPIATDNFQSSKRFFSFLQKLQKRQRTRARVTN